MIISRKWVLITSGFSPAGASFFFARLKITKYKLTTLHSTLSSILPPKNQIPNFERALKVYVIKRYGSPQFLEKVVVLLLQSTLGEPPASTGTDQLSELLGVEVQQVLEVNSSVGELLKNPLFCLWWRLVDG